MRTIVNFAPTGMIPTKAMTPHVPLSVSEIIEDVHMAVEIGITMVHLHVREGASPSRSTGGAKAYARIISGIRKFADDLVICVSLSGRAQHRFDERSEVLGLDGDLKPDMGSLTLSSVNFNNDVSISTPEMIQRLAAEMKQRGILPELEAFDVGMINYAKYLTKKGLLEPPHYFNLLLGNIACAQADILHAGMMIRDLPPDSYWSMAGIGDCQLPVNGVAIAAGGGVRTGIEDNIWYSQKRSKLATNADLLRRVHRLITASEREMMTPDEFRKRLNLQGGKGRYGRAQF
ncbi:MAG: 3-keto-5-aminohexanoate cleavage protein [Pseudomonadota bacterium]